MATRGDGGSKRFRSSVPRREWPDPPDRRDRRVRARSPVGYDSRGYAIDSCALEPDGGLVGCGVLLIEHLTTAVAPICDRLAFLNNGVIELEGPPDAVLRAPAVRAICRL